jgi:hypothetical protein
VNTGAPSSIGIDTGYHPPEMRTCASPVCLLILEDK